MLRGAFLTGLGPRIGQQPNRRNCGKAGVSISAHETTAQDEEDQSNGVPLALAMREERKRPGEYRSPYLTARFGTPKVSDHCASLENRYGPFRSIVGSNPTPSASDGKSLHIGQMGSVGSAILRVMSRSGDR